MDNIEKQQRDQKQQAKLVALIIANPGLDATKIPAHLRRHIRTLEKQVGVITWRDGGWHARSGLTLDAGVIQGLTWDDHAKMTS